MNSRAVSARVSRVCALLVPVGLVLTACVSGVDEAPSGAFASQEPAQASSDQQSSGATAQTRAPHPAEGTTLGLTYIPNIQFAPVYVAEDDSLFTAAGQITTVRHHGADEGLFTALLAGEEDVVVASGDEALVARSQGIDVVSVGTYYQRNPVAVLVPDASDIRDIRGLKGKRIGVPGEYGSSWIGLHAILHGANMSRGDVEVVSIGYTQLAALSAGEVDAIVGFTNNELTWFASAGVPLRALTADALPLVSASLITTSQALAERPNAVCAIVQATESGMRRTVQAPQRAVEATLKRDQSLSTPEAVLGARGVLAATIELFSTDAGAVSARPNVDTWRRMLNFFRAHVGDGYEQIEVSDVVSERCFTN